MKILIIAGLFLFFLPQSFSASPKSFKMKNGTISFLVPKNWEKADGLFGIQLMFLGPMKSENRPVLIVESTDFAGMSFDADSLKKNEVEYKEGRELWLKKYNGKSNEFFNYQTRQLASKATDHSIGFRYEIGEKEFVERSHYITCHKYLYHLKTLVLSSEEKIHNQTFEDVISSFSCK